MTDDNSLLMERRDKVAIRGASARAFGPDTSALKSTCHPTFAMRSIDSSTVAKGKWGARRVAPTWCARRSRRSCSRI